MTNAQIVALGVRLFAIWLAIEILRHLPGLWAFSARDGNVSGFTAIVVLVAVTLIAITLALWRFPLAVARKLLPTATLDQATPLPAEQIERVGFCLLGLWLLADAVRGLAYSGVMLYYSRQPNVSLELRPDNYAAMAQTMVELVLAIWLLFGARGLVGLLRRARAAGTD
jgi:hypothetical protein